MTDILSRHTSNAVSDEDAIGIYQMGIRQQISAHSAQEYWFGVSETELSDPLRVDAGERQRENEEFPDMAVDVLSKMLEDGRLVLQPQAHNPKVFDIIQGMIEVPGQEMGYES